MWAIRIGQLRTAGADAQAAEHPLVDEAELAALGGTGQPQPHPQVPLGRRRRGLHQQLAAHPEVGQQGAPVVEWEPEVLAAAPGAGDPTAPEGVGEAGRTAGVVAHRTRVQHLDVGDRGAHDVTLEAGADDLDLGELGHCASGLRGRRLPVGRGARAPARATRTSASPCSRPSSSRISPYAVWAAPCSASFLDRPVPWPCSVPATPTWAVKVFMWSGPSSVMAYSGTPRPCSAASSCRRGLPVQAGAHRGRRLDQRVEETVHHVRGGGDAATAEVDGPDHGLDGVGEDRGLVATTGADLAPTQLDVLPQTDHPGDLGQRLGVDHRGPQLGQSALGEIGMDQVQRLGDHDPEHGVPRNSSRSLVGRPPFS